MSKNFLKFAALAAGAVVLVSGCGKRAADAVGSIADGQAAMKAGDTRKALVQFKNVVQAQPENGEARFLLAEAYFANRDLPSARKEYERAYELGHNRDGTALRLAELMQEAGDNKVFIDKFSEYQSPNAAVQAEILAQVGRARFTLGNIKAAREDFTRALSFNPNEKLAKLGLIRLQAAAGDGKGAIEALDKLIEQFPDYELAMIGKADLLRGYSDIAGAITALEQAAKVKPSDINMQANLASLYLTVGRYDDADRVIEVLRAKSPPNAPAVHYLSALRHFQKGNLQSAKDSIGVALKLQPETIPYVLLAATIESAAGNFEQAEKHATFVMARSNDKTYARTLLASAYVRAQKGAQALELLNPLINEGTQNPNVFAIAGEAAALTQDMTSASKYFERAAALDPNDPAQKARLALVRLGMGDSARAIADLEASVRADSPTQFADVLLIMTYLRENNYDKALAAVEVFEKKQPKNVLVHNLRASALLGKKDIPGARSALEKGFAAMPDSSSILQNLARVDLLESKRDAALARFEEFVKKYPTDSAALLGYAQLKEQAKAPSAEILSLYERAATGPGRSSAASSQLAAYYSRLGDNAKALATLRDAAQKAPEDTSILSRYGAAQLQQKDGQGAVATFSKLTKLQPHVPDAWIQLAEGYLLSKNDAGAIQSLNKALEIKPSPTAARVMLAQIAQRQGNKDEARRLADELSKESPGASTGPLVAAGLAAVDKDWPRAIAQYKKALELDPKQGSTAARLHAALSQAGQTAEAAALAAKFQKEAPYNVPFLTYLADAELRGGRMVQAIPFYRTVIERDANNVMALNNLAWCLHETKDPSALAVAERAAKLAPRAPAVMDTLGTILSSNGQHDRAIKLLQDAVLAVPDSAEIRLHLAQGQARAGNKEKAKLDADAAVKMPAPESVTVKARQFLQSL